LIHNLYGKGQTAYFTFRIGSLYHHKRHYGHAALVISALKTLLGYTPELGVDASPLIEISRQRSRSDDFEWYGLLNHTGQLGNAFFKPTPVRNITMDFIPNKKVNSVRSLKTDKTLNVIQKQDRLEVTLPELREYDVLLVEYQ
jgi:hypothetical protein